MREWILSVESDWDQVVRELKEELQPPRWIALKGPLGAGKTSFVRWLLKELGHNGIVPSPSYPLMLEYRLPKLRVLHLDAYRLDPRHEAPWSKEFLESSLVLVEWPERSGLAEKDFYGSLELEVLEDDKRCARWKRNCAKD